MNFILIFFVFLFGLIIGSFLNCLIWRLHTGEGLWGRSYCPKCRKQIDWYDNIPLLSFILLRGQCRHCGKSISLQYPLVELITGIFFVVAFIESYELRVTSYELFAHNILISDLLTSNFLLLTLKYWFLIAVMIVVFVYDLRWYLILDIVALPACAVILVLNILIQYLECSQSFHCVQWSNMAISGIIGGSFFLLQFLISNGKWIGGGDIRLGLLMGLALGWPNILIALSLAYFIGAFFSILLVLSGRKKWGSRIPLGIFLSTATVITLFWGQEIMDWYFSDFINIILFN